MLRRVRRLSTGVGTSGLRNAIQAGNDLRDGSTVFKFFPPNLRIKTNTTVRLQMTRRTSEAHTFTFGPINGRDAYVDRIGATLIAPVPGGGDAPPTLVFNPLAVFLSEDPAGGVPTITPTTHGNGFYNSGLLDRNPASPSPPSVRVRFGAAGTYDYLCALHPWMRGKVTVSD